MKSLLILFVLPLFLFAEENAHVKAFREAEALFERHSIVPRPKGDDLRTALECRAKSDLDPLKLSFTDKDFKSLTEINCYDGICKGDTSRLDKMLELLISRLKLQEEWMLAQPPLSFTTDESIPTAGRWADWAKDEGELHARWRKDLMLTVLEVAASSLDMPPNQAELKAIQETVIKKWIAETEERIAYLKSMSPEAKLAIVRETRFRCTDQYAAFFSPETQVQGGANTGLTTILVNDGIIFGADHRTILAIAPGSAASLSKNILHGDRVVSIKIGDQQITPGTPEFRKYEETSFPNGTQVEFEIERNGQKHKVPLTLNPAINSDSVVVRRDIPAEGKIFRHIGVPKFIQADPSLSPKEDISTFSQVGRALFAPGSYDAVFLDLRGNGGGIAEEGAWLASLFLPPDESHTSVTLGRAAENERYFLTRTGHPQTNPDVPLFILTDRATGSAAEITVRALKQANRGIVIGDRTHGKGIEQLITQISDGSEFKFTTRVNVGHNGQTFHGKGIEPDLKVPFFVYKEKLPPDSQEIEIPKYSPDYATHLKPIKEGGFRANRAAIEALSGHLEELKSNHPRIKEYYQALQSFIATGEEKTTPLNAEKFFEQSRTERKAENLRQVAEQLSLHLAAEYLKAEITSQKETEAKAQSGNVR